MRLLLACCALAGLAAPEVAAKPCIAPTYAEIAGAWIANDVVGGYLLDLDADGSGVLVHEFLDRPHDTYSVRLVGLRDRRIEFAVSASPAPTSGMFMRGTTCRGVLWLEIGERSPKWKTELEFRRRDEIMGRIERLAATAERMKTRSRR